MTFPRLREHHRTRSQKLTATVAGLVALVVLAIVLSNRTETSADTSSPPGDMHFGALGSTCAIDRVGALKAAGVTRVQMDVRWDRLEPTSGRWGSTYKDELLASIRNCRSAGLDIALGLGLQYAPEWVRRLPDGQYLDQHGTPSPSGVPNIVFSNDVREAFASYAAALIRLIPSAGIYAIRVGTSEAGELGYPVRSGPEASDRKSLWAFNDSAQSGEGLPAGIAPTPLPGWKPGDRQWRGSHITSEQSAGWFSWYAASVAQSVAWQVDLLTALGFEGEFHLPLAGRGALPSDLREAAAAALDGTADRDGSIQRGLYYPEQLRLVAALTPEARVLANATGLDDATAVAARKLSPPQDSCSPEDVKMDALTAENVQQWSASRWTIANARQAGLDVIGENPGSSSAPGTGGDKESDNLRSQMHWAPRYAAECGLRTFFWAFEDDLFGAPEQLEISDYATTIQELRGPVGAASEPEPHTQRITEGSTHARHN